MVSGVGEPPMTFLSTSIGIGAAPSNSCEVDVGRRRLPAALPDASARMHVPGIVGSIGADMDAELARGGVEHHLRRSAAFWIEDQELLKFDVFQDARDRPENLPGCRERHLDIARPGKDDRIADPMVRQIAQDRPYPAPLSRTAVGTSSRIPSKG